MTFLLPSNSEEWLVENILTVVKIYHIRRTSHITDRDRRDMIITHSRMRTAKTMGKNYKLESAKKAAEKAVAEFEKYTIKSAQDAINFETKYNDVLAVIAQIPDEYEQSSYKRKSCIEVQITAGRSFGQMAGCH